MLSCKEYNRLEILLSSVFEIAVDLPCLTTLTSMEKEIIWILFWYEVIDKEEEFWRSYLHFHISGGDFIAEILWDSFYHADYKPQALLF